MAPDIHTFALLLLFARGNNSYFTEEENLTAVNVSGKYGDGFGRPHYDKCEDDGDCGPGKLCLYGHCYCERGFYFSNGCKRCPGYNQYCGFARCCDDPALFCSGNICRCKEPDSEECRNLGPHNNAGSVRMVNAFQIILASIFSIALFALLIQCWRTCCGKKKLLARQPAIQDSSGPAVVDVEGVTRSYPPLDRLSVARDAPPRYDDLNHFQFEKPPPYQEAVNLSPYFQVERQSEEYVPGSQPTAPVDDSRGVDNAAFNSDDLHNVTTPRADSVPEDRQLRTVVATDNHLSLESQRVTCNNTVDTGADVIASVDTTHQPPESLKDEQTGLPVAPANRVIVCQVHRTESSV